MTSKSLGSDDGSAETKRGVKRDHDGDGPGNQDAGHDAHLPLGLPIANLPDSSDDLNDSENKGNGHDDAEGDTEALLELSRAGGGLGKNRDREFSHNDASLSIDWLCLRSYLLIIPSYPSPDNTISSLIMNVLPTAFKKTVNFIF
jgi:hypothetical protein